MTTIDHRFNSIDTKVSLLLRLWQHFGLNHKRQSFALLLLMIIASLAEVISIGAVFPFLGVLIDPEKIYFIIRSNPFGNYIQLQKPSDLLLPLTIIFCAASLLSGAIRLALLWATMKFSFSVGADLSASMFRKTLYQPYSVHVSRNSSSIISGISIKVGSVIYHIITPLLTGISSAIILIFLVIALLSFEPFLIFNAFLGFSIIYICIVLISKKYLKNNSVVIAYESKKLIQILQEGLGGIRDILIDGSQEVYCKEYVESDSAMRRAQGSNQFIGNSPRYALEALGMILIAVLAYGLVQEPQGVESAIPVLGVLALGAQRLLPMFQQLYTSWSSIKGNEENLRDALVLLDQQLPTDRKLNSNKPLEYQSEIVFKKVSFSYDSSDNYTLKDIDINIKKGSKVGIIGATGSGKSTLTDIMMGLLKPSSGNLLVDGVSINQLNCHQWQLNIAHVPQSIYLADASIAQNIAFGVPEELIDCDRVRQAAERAKISDLVDSWSMGYQSRIGERGVQLSGGQRQRIGIARALYKKARVLILDEATSALDAQTENSVMTEINDLDPNLTILIVAHRLETLKGCSQIIELSKGSILRVGTYSEIIFST
ncbi:ABC transporter ATP-binding protein [Polynucleobacter paneuropaeus]|uniref:ABC transporter ATP-binding protein n=1 Tax=Polynucleobacter paneuropaeus TaxID=2527775 RepID=UPI001BFD6FFD|nr:ABC transporter ATP-binding protein [Polynucleobacter paneuropaeus]